ncbi:MAG: hypothetical protein RBS46_03020 [Methyloversatilis sp.]|jgi:hypothetical protein|nr:hypothetical protein [Methyloversatilis sp.]
MSLHLVLPGLLWPPSSPLPAPRTPALSLLLGRGTCSRRTARSPEQVLAALFELGGDAPLGALRRAGFGEPADTRCWMAADATHLRFARDALMLTAPPDAAPDAHEAAALAASWNAHFAGVGWLHLPAGGHGHLALLEAIEVDTLPPGAALGRKLDASMPTGRDAGKLRQWMNETQMLLHAHPVNAAREEAGRPAINSLWFWGAGALPVSAAIPCLQLWADDPLAHGLAQAAAIRAAPLPERPEVAMQEGNLVLLQDALPAALYLDGAAWTQAVEAIDAQWITPALRALKRGDVQSVTVTLTGDDGVLACTTERLDLWKLWRRPRALTAPGP